MLSVKPKSANANQKKQQQGHGQSGWEFVHGKTKDGKERRGRRTRQMWHVFECAGVGLNQRFLRNCQKKNSEEGERNMWKQWARPLKQSKMIVIMGEGNCNKAAHLNKEHTHSQTYTHTHTPASKHTNFMRAGPALLGLFGALTARQAHCGGFTFRFGFSLRFSWGFRFNATQCAMQ